MQHFSKALKFRLPNLDILILRDLYENIYNSNAVFCNKGGESGEHLRTFIVTLALLTNTKISFINL